MLSIAKKVFGSENDRKLKKMRPLVAKINGLEPQFEKLTDDQLKLKTEEYKKRVADGESLDALLPEAFATVREAAKRTLGQRHYDVQLIGGISMHQGMIAEMRTGEGKTLVATLAAYLNALTGKGVHVVTVNDYLASRDAEWMGQVYGFLGLTTGVIVSGLSPDQRKAAYACDITYATNNELGFDYLRDNMKYAVADMAQRGHIYAIIDEIDSILIDEARTPLIISGPTDDKSEFYRTIDTLIPLLGEDDFELDEKARSASYTEEGMEKMEGLLRERGLMEGESLYDIENVSVVHHINQALKAHKVFIRDKDYIVKDGKVVIIDEFTGRMMDGRRWSEGLHQAVEAKENADIQPENVTLASVTYQNYFRLYDKLSGMTGTALTEASEFAEIYKLEVLEIPTNRPIQRIDEDDVIYRTEKEKFNAIVEEIRECQKKGQPILVGTVSIEKSEMLSEHLTQHGIEHKVLNARFHDQEAAIVAQAGVPGAVTIATNMAGRGTDIQLGGNLDMRLDTEAPDGETEKQREKRAEKIKEEIASLKEQALKAGGLYVLATERHESRRIDNQLRGRTGRQGDPGKSKFYISTEDDLMRIFGGERLKNMMGKMGWEEGEHLTNRFMSKAVEKAQVKVEARNFDIRKNLLKYDDVMNEQRKAIFEQRLEFMTDDNVSDVIEDMRHGVCEDMIAEYIPAKAYAEDWDIDGLVGRTREIFALDLPFKDWAGEEGIADEEILERFRKATDDVSKQLSAPLGEDQMRGLEKQILLQVIDRNWQEHLQQLDALKSYVGVRAHGQRDPLNEYKSDAFKLFDKLLANLREGVTQNMSRLLVQVAMQNQQRQQMQNDAMKAAGAGRPLSQGGSAPTSPRGEAQMLSGMSLDRSDEPTGSVDDLDPKALEGLSRNAPCPCGSGRKVKHCHGNVKTA